MLPRSWPYSTPARLGSENENVRSSLLGRILLGFVVVVVVAVVLCLWGFVGFLFLLLIK